MRRIAFGPGTMRTLALMLVTVTVLSATATAQDFDFTANSQNTPGLVNQGAVGAVSSFLGAATSSILDGFTATDVAIANGSVFGARLAWSIATPFRNRAHA